MEKFDFRFRRKTLYIYNIDTKKVLNLKSWKYVGEVNRAATKKVFPVGQLIFSSRSLHVKCESI